MDDSDIIQFLLSDDQDSDFKHLLDEFSDLHVNHERVSEPFSFSNKVSRIRGVDYAIIGANQKKSRGKRRIRSPKCRRPSWDGIFDMADGIITEEHSEQNIREAKPFNGDKKTTPQKKKTKSLRSKVNVLPGRSSNPEQNQHQDNDKVNVAKKPKRKQNPLLSSEFVEINSTNLETQNYSRPGGKASEGKRSNDAKSRNKSNSRSLKDGKFPELRDKGRDLNSPNNEEPQLEKSTPKKKKSKKPKVLKSVRQRPKQKFDGDSSGLFDSTYSGIKSNAKKTSVATDNTGEILKRQSLNERPTCSEKKKSKKCKQSESKREKKNTDTTKKIKSDK